MEILDGRGKSIPEATLKLSKDEVTDLLVETSQVDDGSKDHALLRDESGRTLAIYVETNEKAPLEKHFDWWLGPVILIFIVLVAVGAITVARGIVSLIF